MFDRRDGGQWTHVPPSILIVELSTFHVFWVYRLLSTYRFVPHQLGTSPNKKSVCSYFMNGLHHRIRTLGSPSCSNLLQMSVEGPCNLRVSQGMELDLQITEGFPLLRTDRSTPLLATSFTLSHTVRLPCRVPCLCLRFRVSSFRRT